MFIETYYDERHMVPASSREPAIPYPELAGEELSVWQRYLPVTTELGKVPFGSITRLNLSLSSWRKHKSGIYLTASKYGAAQAIRWPLVSWAENEHATFPLLVGGTRNLHWNR